MPRIALYCLILMLALSGCMGIVSSDDPRRILGTAHLRPGQTTLSELNMVLGDPEHTELLSDGSERLFYTTEFYGYHVVIYAYSDDGATSTVVSNSNSLEVMVDKNGILKSYDIHTPVK
ncbi:MAG: hypothetical protein LBG06_04655 [Deltaproteobacteria bacterium]|nr:hypothetical protein [Deltaproteobacteria bacterium]